MSVTSLAFSHGALIDSPARQVVYVLEGTQNSGIFSEAYMKSGNGTLSGGSGGDVRR